MTNKQYARTAEASHWYTRDGEPKHEVDKADGTGKRPTTALDAKKLGLLPSVTNVLGVLAKPTIDTWKTNNILKAAVELRGKYADDTDEQWTERIQDIADKPSLEARDFGTAMHKAIEDWLKSHYELWPEDESLWPYLDGFKDWYKKEGLQVEGIERTFALPSQGYAGTADLMAGGAVVDWKTQNAETEKALRHYPDWVPQIAAYKKAVKAEKAATVAISSKVPGLISINWCKTDELERGYETFLAARTVFYGINGKGKNLDGPSK